MNNKIEEKIINKKSVYFINGKQSSTSLIKEDKTFRLYKNNIEIKNFSKYMDYIASSKDYNTYRKKGYIIYLFYIFIEYMECDILNLSKKDIHSLIFFLAGENQYLENAHLLTKRNSISVSGDISAIRVYLSFLGIENSFLGYSSSRKSVREITSFIKKALGDVRYGKTLDDFLTEDEFNVLISLTKSHNDLTSETIIKLLFNNGLRLGEILGITLEDIQDPIKTGPDSYEYRILLRNRRSDKSYQHCTYYKQSFPYEPISQKEHTNYYDYPVIIDGDMYSLLIEYIENTKAIRNMEYCSADNLTNKYDKNYYVFISKRGHGLSDQIWNKILRDYFSKASIPLIAELTGHNLSGKVRKGYIAKRVNQLVANNTSVDTIKSVLAFELRYTDTYHIEKIINTYLKS